MLFTKYLQAVEDKCSVININLDPALPRQRKNDVIPNRFILEDDKEALLDFSLEVIGQVSDYCCSIKLNTQYFLGACSILERLVKEIHTEGMIAILDHKLSDIGSTNDSAIFWISEMGFDAFTFSPIAGNIRTTVTKAHERHLGVLVLTLMSNPEAKNLMINTIQNGQPYYIGVAKAVAKTHADGCVVGLTSYVKSAFVKNIQEIVGDRVIFLLQGIGPQGGDIANIKYVTNPLVSLGREAIYSENPRETVRGYNKLVKSIRLRRA